MLHISSYADVRIRKVSANRIYFYYQGQEYFVLSTFTENENRCLRLFKRERVDSSNGKVVFRLTKLGQSFLVPKEIKEFIKGYNGVNYRDWYRLNPSLPCCQMDIVFFISCLKCVGLIECAKEIENDIDTIIKVGEMRNLKFLDETELTRFTTSYYYLDSLSR